MRWLSALQRRTPESTCRRLNLRRHRQHRLVLPRPTHNLHSNRQSLRRTPHRHHRRRIPQQIKPLRITHRLQIFHLPPLHHPFPLAMTKRRHSASRTQQNRKRLHLAQPSFAQSTPPHQRIQPLPPIHRRFERHAFPPSTIHRTQFRLPPLDGRSERHLYRAPE